MSISIKSSKNDIIYTLNSDVLIYVNEFTENEIELSHIMQKDTPFEDLLVLPFYWKLVVNHNNSESKKRDKFIYDLLKSRDYLFNIRKVEWMSGVDAPISDLLYGTLGLRNLKRLTFGDSFNLSLSQPLEDSLHGLSNLTHLTFGNDFNQPLEDSLQGLSSLSHRKMI